jgi:hypothetical protein
MREGAGVKQRAGFNRGMIRMRLWPWVLCFGVATGVGASPFTVVIYNVENLFDADEVAIYDDYQADRYTPAHFATKLENIAEIVAVFD